MTVAMVLKMSDRWETRPTTDRHAGGTARALGSLIHVANPIAAGWRVVVIDAIDSAEGEPTWEDAAWQ